MNIDYKKSSFHQISDYRTSQSRAHRFLLSAERNAPSTGHILCEELKNSWTDYRPKSESVKEFQWKINRYRNVREDLAIPHDRVRYNHQFSDKIKAMEIVKPMHNSSDLAFTKLPREVKPRSSFNPPPIEHTWLENSFTSTPGCYKFMDNLLSTTDLDFHQHKDYSNARTKLIPRVDLPFNSNVASFIPKSKLIKQNPITKLYAAKNVRDISAFTAPTLDRITITKVPYRGLESEMRANY